MVRTIRTERVTLLDGGMGRELLRMGAPFRQPEWSALALMETPHLVSRAHEQFALAGCDILTTNNYAVVPYHIGEERFVADGAALAARAGQLASDVAARFGCRVAGALPPLFGSYRPDLFEPARGQALLEQLIEALDPFVDIWLAETVSSIAEAEAVVTALKGDRRSLWLAYTLRDDEHALHDIPRLRSGESVAAAAHSGAEQGAAAILFNCSRPEVMAPAIDIVQQIRGERGASLAIGAYANAFSGQSTVAQANVTLHDIRQELDPAGYATFAEHWCQQGASIVGGCCGIGPQHISLLQQRLKK